MLLLLRKGVTVNVDVMDTFSVDDNMDGGQDRSAEPQMGTPQMRKKHGRKGEGQQGTTRDTGTGTQGEGEGGTLAEPETLTRTGSPKKKKQKKKKGGPPPKPSMSMWRPPVYLQVLSPGCPGPPVWPVTLLGREHLVEEAGQSTFE